MPYNLPYNTALFREHCEVNLYICSLTRLKLHSVMRMPAFLKQSYACIKQARQANGLIYGATIFEPLTIFSTVTIWETMRDMQRYIATGAHRQAMPQLRVWCSDAVTTHFEWQDTKAPSWDECLLTLKSGRFVPVLNPSKYHATGELVPKRRAFPSEFFLTSGESHVRGR